MYAIAREDGLFFCDGTLYRDKQGPRSIWQSLDGAWSPYCDKDILIVTIRATQLERICRRQLTVIKLTEQDIEYLTFRKLRSF